MIPVIPTDGSPEVSAEEMDRIRTRVRLMIEMTARAGRFRRGLQQAVARLSEEEVTVVADLERLGLDVTGLRDLLQGTHVLIDQPDLYERWMFPRRSRQRVSTHHAEVDKARYPDYGIRGPLVGEMLHGRTAHGTWLQLQKTWGRSGSTEQRSTYLSPSLAARVRIPQAVSDELTGVSSESEKPGNATSALGELAARFPPPSRANDLMEVSFSGVARGRGLFGSSEAWITRTASTLASDLLGGDQPRLTWSPPALGTTRPRTIHLGSGHGLQYAVRQSSAAV